MDFPRECADVGAMQALGRELGAALRGGGVIALDGELGAGKTELVKGLAAGVEYCGAVTSPTFTLLHEYKGGLCPLYHLDFYRLESEEELIQLGWDELLEEPGSLLAVEWGSRFPALLPAQTLALKLEILPTGARRVHLADR